MSPESTLWRHHESTKGSRFHSSSNSIAISATVRGPEVVPSLQGWESCFDKRVSICGGRWSATTATPTGSHQLGHRDCGRWSATAATPTGSHQLEHRDCGWRSPEAAAPTASHQFVHRESRIAASTYPHNWRVQAATIAAARTRESAVGRLSRLSTALVPCYHPRRELSVL
jgi:hypothetical protein